MRYLVVPLGGEVITKVVHVDTGVPELLGYLHRRPGDVKAKAALQSPSKLSNSAERIRLAGALGSMRSQAPAKGWEHDTNRVASRWGDAWASAEASSLAQQLAATNQLS